MPKDGNLNLLSSLFITIRKITAKNRRVVQGGDWGHQKEERP